MQLLWVVEYSYALMYAHTQGEALDNALVQLGPVEHGWSEETMAREVEGMREEVTAFKTQLHTLNSIRKKMRYVCLDCCLQ